MPQTSKTLVAVLASHDSESKNIELVRVFEELFKEDKEKLAGFHFVFTGGTYRRIVEGIVPPDWGAFAKLDDKVSDWLWHHCGVTVLPDRTRGGVTILANLVVQRQCSIIWPFLSPITTHWLNPENLALTRLSDHWNAKRFMNVASVRCWFRREAERDIASHPQRVVPLTVTLGSPIKRGKRNYPWPKAKLSRDRTHHEILLPPRPQRSAGWYGNFNKQSVALIAHDQMKSRMVDFTIQYENELLEFDRILATGTTGQEVRNACRELRRREKIIRCLSGPKGGDIEIATEILFGRCHVVVFFIDPLNPHPHIDDIRVVFSACMSEVCNWDVRMLTNEVHAREWIEEAVRRK